MVCGFTLQLDTLIFFIILFKFRINIFFIVFKQLKNIFIYLFTALTSSETVIE